MSEPITHNISEIVQGVLARSYDYRVPLKRFYIYLHAETMKMFPKLGKKRNTSPVRGVLWKWFASQYTRKNGNTVPAYGIPGKVKGRMRMSGKRVTESSRIMQDRGILRNAALGHYQISTHQILMNTPLKYAGMQNKKRPFVFITDNDVDRLREIIIDYLVTGGE